MRRLEFLFLLFIWAAGFVGCLAEAEQTEGHVEVRGYAVVGEPKLSTNSLSLSRYTGTNMSLSTIVKAASELQMGYRSQGYTNVSVSVAPDRIANGIVTLYVFRTPLAQILISGKRYPISSEASTEQHPLSQASSTNNIPPTSGAPSTTKKNSVAHFTVHAYEIHGDTLLTTSTLMSLLVKYTGTNVTIADVLKAASDLQLEYRNRGYPTVSVTIPQQQITNGIVKIRVFQGRLADVLVTGNRYFSSNNVMRALPSLRTNMILSGPVFQAELDRANANQDRQIYPELNPGPAPNTTDLQLRIKDRLPLHAKIDFNNQSSPGTPDLRLNTSAVYNNLWQLEHSVGVQYGFSPEAYKSGDWSFYDLPLVANYSAFYRLPLGNPERVEDLVSTQPGTFGFNEATRQFRLPGASGAPELNFYASRSTIDTAVMTVFSANLFNTNGNSLDRQDVQQDVTITSDVGSRLTLPLRASGNFQSSFSGGPDFKAYDLTSAKTNFFILTSTQIDTTSDPSHPTTNVFTFVRSNAIPTTINSVDYTPLAFRYDATLRDRRGSTTFGLGFNVNLWKSVSRGDFDTITGSSQSTGYWVTLTPSIARDLIVYPNWVLTLRADGQWASEPLLSNERFGAGGVNSVRGYREGEVFGDTGWHISAEQKTPAHVVGIAYDKAPMTIRGAIYMDYSETYLLDPNGAKSRTALWGMGFGGVISVGPHWEARFLFSLPLLSAGTTEAYQPRFNFSLIGQF